MSASFFKKLYSTIVFKMTMLNNDQYWLLNKLVHELPAFSSIKTMKFEKGVLMYGDSDIGNHSADNTYAIVNCSKMLEAIKKDNYDIFYEDFMSLSQMTYFIYCYVLNPFEPEETYTKGWQQFTLNTNSKDIVSSFNNTKKSLMSLLKEHYNPNLRDVQPDTLISYRKRPPIFSNYGMVFDKNGNEYKLLHYTVNVSSTSHISIVLIESFEKKYYKLSRTFGKNNVDLFHVNTNGYEHFNFNIKDFKPYQEIQEFVGDFSLELIKGIYPDYDQDVLPNSQYKQIFDMVGY